jgi:hypothetical protein
MARILALLPDALVCVAEEERADYAAVVPAKQLLCHNVVGLPTIRNWMADTIQENCIVEVDDDLRCVRCFVSFRPRRKITDPTAIRQVIENSLRVAEDLDVGVLCWSRSMNTVLMAPETQPIRVTTPVSCSFGLRGKARHRRFDETLNGRDDLDFTLRTLLEDRILYADMRFYFDHGRIFSGLGGNVGLITHQHFNAATAEIQRRWGEYVAVGGGRFGERSTVTKMGIRVQRQSPTSRANLD